MPVIHEIPRLHRAVLLGAGLVIIAAGLRAAAPIANLVLVSLLLAMTVYPIPYLLTQRGLSRALAVTLTLLLVLVGGAALVLVLAASLTRLADEAPKYGPALSNLVDAGTRLLTARGIDVSEALKPSPERALAFVQGLARGALGALGNSIFVLILIALFLLEMPLARPGAGASAFALRLEELGKSVRRFVGLNGMLGAAAAVANFLVMIALGTDFPVIWAVLCFLFAFVPFGFLVSLIPPLLVTLLEHGGGRALALFVIFLVINTVADNVVKPKVMGEGLGISPLVIVLSLLVWMFVLGPVGALLAIPLTIAIGKTVPLLVEGADSA
jgi:predicted PurR-regulated permease PerM